MKLLRELIETPSPSGKESAVQKIVIRELQSYGIKPKVDSVGNVYAFSGCGPTRGDLNGEVLFTAHMDSVHNDHPVIIEEAKIVDFSRSRVPVMGWSLAEGCQQSALGADDKVGVRILLHLIKHGVRGLFLFTVSEEVGCVGARHAAKSFKEGMVKYAICFDRKDTTSVITAMGGTTCCTDDFAQAIIDGLGMGHVKDRGGSTTDTKSFSAVTGNFTNISAGYYHEHGKTEWLDIGYVKRLMENVITVDWSDLPVEKPVVPVYASPPPRRTNYDDDDYWWAKRGKGVSGSAGRGNVTSLFRLDDMFKSDNNRLIVEITRDWAKKLKKDHEWKNFFGVRIAEVVEEYILPELEGLEDDCELLIEENDVLIQTVSSMEEAIAILESDKEALHAQLRAAELLRTNPSTALVPVAYAH